MINIKFKIKYTKIKRTNKVIICYLLILFAAQICSCDRSKSKKIVINFAHFTFLQSNNRFFNIKFTKSQYIKFIIGFENQNVKNLTLKERLDIEKNIFHPNEEIDEKILFSILKGKEEE